MYKYGDIFPSRYPQTKFIPIQYQDDYDIIVRNRVLSVIFALLTLFNIFAIGKKLGNFISGIAASFLLAINPLFYATTRLAYSDSILVFFITLSFTIYSISTLGLASWKDYKRNIFYGILLGITASSKLNGFLSLMFSVLFELVLIIKNLLLKQKNPIKKTREFSIKICIWVIVSLSVFVLLHPYVWFNFKGIQTMIDYRYDIAVLQQIGHPEIAYYSFNDRVHAVYRRTLAPGGEFTSLSKLNRYADTLLFLIGIFFLIKQINLISWIFLITKIPRAYARGIFSSRFVGNKIPQKWKILRIHPQAYSRGFLRKGINAFLYKLKNITSLLTMELPKNVFHHTDISIKIETGKKTYYLLLLWFVGLFIAMSIYITVGYVRYFLPIIPFIVLIESLGVYYLTSYVYLTFKKIYKKRNNNFRLS